MLQTHIPTFSSPNSLAGESLVRTSSRDSISSMNTPATPTPNPHTSAAPASNPGGAGVGHGGAHPPHLPHTAAHPPPAAVAQSVAAGGGIAGADEL